MRKIIFEEMQRCLTRLCRKFHKETMQRNHLEDLGRGGKFSQGGKFNDPVGEDVNDIRKRNQRETKEAKN